MFVKSLTLWVRSCSQFGGVEKGKRGGIIVCVEVHGNFLLKDEFVNYYMKEDKCDGLSKIGGIPKIIGLYIIMI